MEDAQGGLASERPTSPTTLAIDIGGSGLKASVLDADGRKIFGRVRTKTPYPCRLESSSGNSTSSPTNRVSGRPVFIDGSATAHLELAHMPFRGRGTFQVELVDTAVGILGGIKLWEMDEASEVR